MPRKKNNSEEEEITEEQTSKRIVGGIITQIKRKKPELYEKLQALAKQHGMKMSDYLVYVISKTIEYEETLPTYFKVMKMIDEIEWETINKESIKAAFSIILLGHEFAKMQASLLSDITKSYLVTYPQMVEPYIEKVIDTAKKYHEMINAAKPKEEEKPTYTPPPPPPPPPSPPSVVTPTYPPVILPQINLSAFLVKLTRFLLGYFKKISDNLSKALGKKVEITPDINEITDIMFSIFGISPQEVNIPVYTTKTESSNTVKVISKEEYKKMKEEEVEGEE